MVSSFDPTGLNTEQKEAVLHESGPLMVFAGAGSGKTRVITSRIARLVSEGTPPYRILAVTFTNKAANEMRGRIEELVGEPARQIWMGTFHSVCARLLRIEGKAIGLDPNFVVYDDADQVSLVKDLLKRRGLDDKSLQPRAVLSEISRAKERLLSPQKYQEQAAGYFEKTVSSVYTDYNKALAAANALDFDDILVKAVRLLEQAQEVRERYQERFLHVLVDEYQDVNFAQYRLVSILAERHKNVTIVGDDDQSIYAWRGADVSLMLRFQQDHPGAEVVKLTQNYRSTKRILKAAHEVIRHNRSRAEKELWTDNTEGAPVTVTETGTEQDEAMLVTDTILRQVRRGERKYRDFAVLYRTNSQSRVLEEAMLTMRVPHVLVGGQRFYERREVKDMVAYLRLALNTSDDVSLRRIANVPTRGLGPGALEKLAERSAEIGGPLWSALVDEQWQSGLNSKGRSGAKALVGAVQEAAQMAQAGPVTPVLKHLMNASGYLDALRSERSEEAQARLENLQELINVTTEFDAGPEPPTLGAFLESVALVSDIDEFEDGSDAVTLMTLHSSKGLEFPVVFLVGLEEGVFPHSRSIGDDTGLEEERRLCYVGMTRAKEELNLLHAHRRTLFGQPSFNPRSRFIEDALPGGAPALEGAPATTAPRGLRGLRQERTGKYTHSEPDDYEEIEDDGSTVESRRAPVWEPPFKVGQKVAHAKFGVGVVVSCSPLKGDAEVTVAFPGATGVKKLVQSFAKLEPA
ncbi:MAG TPA: UvrD-helicase domain-containing protein [Fimbriimonadaceae bacterium]|nr:UvrD-helicase domain-containing protein [Fimbriimonadaceae bacterium]